MKSLIRKCEHKRVRCIHGDEINWRMKQYVFRFWKPDVIRRQSCLDCGRALDRDAICTILGEDIHEIDENELEDLDE